MSFTKKLLHLKNLTSKGKDFLETFEYFFAEISEKSIEHKESVQINSDFYQLIATPILQKKYGKEIKIFCFVSEIKNENFVFGTLNLSTKAIGAIYYFTDIQCGMLAIMNDGLETDFYRLQPLEGNHNEAYTACEPAMNTVH